MVNKRKVMKNENGITITILAITIAILMLLAGVSMLIFEKTDVIGHTEQSINEYYNDKQAISNEVDKMTLNFDKKNNNWIDKTMYSWKISHFVVK